MFSPTWFISGLRTTYGRDLASQILARGCKVMSSEDELDEFRNWLRARHRTSLLPRPETARAVGGSQVSWHPLAMFWKESAPITPGSVSDQRY